VIGPGHLEGILTAPPGERLMDLLLHCLLDLRSFPPQHQRTLAATLAELRRDPVAAGRVAERVERSLAPALPWSFVLDAVAHERWDELLTRRTALARQRPRRAPLAPEQALPPSEPPSPRESTEAEEHSDQVTRKQIRGSGLLLTGRGLSMGLKFVAELIVVRYLATSDYGAWTYALAVVTFFRGVSAFGLHRALTRYLPLHLERGEHREFYEVLLFSLGLLVIAGLSIVAAFFAFPGAVAAVAGVAADQPLGLLAIVIFLVPFETLDTALMGVSAAFGDSRTLFIRRFVLHPGLRLAIAIVLVSMQADVTLLAYGYLFAGVVGVSYYAASVVTQMRSRDLLHRRLLRGLRPPVRKVLGYTAPVMAADWCTVYMVTAGPLLLGYFSDMSAVALYQVVVPAAALNTVVFQSFGMLFEPSASRLAARGDRPGLNELYWRSAVWVAVLSFPFFALSFTAAVPLTTTLFGERYAASAPILSLLAMGHFFDAMAGFNAATLRVTGQVRWLLLSSAAGAATTILVGVLLVPAMGPVGAGVGMASGYLLFALLKQVVLQRTSGVRGFHPAYRAPYLAILGVVGGLATVRLLWADNVWLVTTAVLLGSLVVYASARATLSITATFPELGRSKLMRTILG